MKVTFDKFDIRTNVKGDYQHMEVDIRLRTLMNKIFSEYKKRRDVEDKWEIKKLSEFNDYSKFGMKDAPDVLPSYFWIYEWHESTPHGSFTNIKYQKKGTEQDYKVFKALKAIQNMLKEEE